ncbi:hypothetical protein [Geobacillus thermodenitrificans]|uniref:YqaS-like protein n=1 Tax=Geobacillus thermodenitrificans (strain NG80-2) TaxID=420246 RepID=A4IS76_GEOTN|nr:hypothetical protein [Geobacillus thermodenitrificans]ABO68180.1 YqaS-like protein [Geobacillus thermodenitrificans NG80-2]MED0662209.1 hypothetical protein [Geobacillus thermodenitrificans]
MRRLPSKKSNVTTEKFQRYRHGSRKGEGNLNLKNLFIERNSTVLKQGFFSGYIPKETLEIMRTLEKSNPVEIWDQIMIQYAAIIRVQQIMFVESKEETSKK